LGWRSGVGGRGVQPWQVTPSRLRGVESLTRRGSGPQLSRALFNILCLARLSISTGRQVLAPIFAASKVSITGLRSLDSEMALFSAMTAEEEAASAVIAALKTKRYNGADVLNPWSHPHKVGVIHMARAVARLLHEFSPDVKVRIQSEPPRIDVAITNLDKLGGPKDISAVLDKPLNMLIRSMEKKEDGEQLVPVDFSS
jgi:hypothetical protein